MASTNTPAATAAAPAADENKIDRVEISRLFGIARSEVSGLVNDANRRRPFYAPSRNAAHAKAGKALAALVAFIDEVDKIKKG